ncbi:oxepin-CoA hydrolase, alternative type [Chachezhania antarctica]|uniref:oxepin-CoA hydrolase, alternative type n=1 Tax=Chachezhania antarctica TaxID=2340860 RepID=UPI000EB11673|nr:enoyl-CoA hydratase family protein [Chachezhania antarctica]|tara:strand:+ start:220 stop:1026 length:807 start_codon:yes stop_codon:yes gene_type:complete
MTTQTSPATDVVTELDSAVLTIALDGPKTRNSISAPVYKELQSAIIMAGENPEIRAIVLTGRHGFFSSGGNINALKASAQSTMAEVTGNTDALNAMIIAIRSCPTPVIAAVEGGAAGAGMSLALACDMIVAAEGAKFVVAYVKIGLAPDGGVTHFLSAALPRQLVTEMCLTGNPVEAERLHALGVVNAVTPVGETLSTATTMAAKLAAGPAGSMAIIKSEIAAAPTNDLATHLALEASGINRARFGAEAAEGLSAFLEKRKPDFTGKG